MLVTNHQHAKSIDWIEVMMNFLQTRVASISFNTIPRDFVVYLPFSIKTKVNDKATTNHRISKTRVSSQPSRNVLFIVSTQLVVLTVGPYPYKGIA